VIRVLVAAQSPMVRARLEALLVGSASVSVVASTSVDQLADDIEAHEPQVVLLAWDVPNAAPLASRLVLSPDAASRMPAFVVLTEVPNAALAADALRDGARSVLPRDALPDEIVAALEAAAVGLVTLPAELANDLLQGSRATGPVAVRQMQQSAALTRREIEILGMLAEGLANKNIAARLGISEHTVKTHVASILGKLDAYSRAEAVAIGVRRGILLL
jgi:DNA-binding NarL/FixJ family response regulator